ncbi:MAG: hypothetical protein PVF49_12545 [Anaerolineales bacterium]|jgi:hypothetical protein
MSPSIEAGLWVLVSLAAQPAVQWLWPHLKGRVGEWADLIERTGPWLLAVGPLYLSLMTGAVLGSRVGLYGFGLEGSLLGAGTGLLMIAGLYAVVRYLPDRVQLPEPPAYEGVLLDEMRWAFYRGAAASWMDLFWLGGFFGWGLAVVEWLLRVRPWKDAAWREPELWEAPIRAAVSAGLYLISRNVWLVIALQLLLIWVWRFGRQRVEHDQEAGS